MTSQDVRQQMRHLEPYLFEIPKDAFHGMRVPARVYVTEQMLKEAARDRSLVQLVNVATLPGIVEYAIAMPDVHEGYGFPIGGVAATRLPHGVISPGGVGYDINCGVRMLLSDKTVSEVEPLLTEVANQFMRAVPSGTGRGGRLKLKPAELDEVLRDGAHWCVRRGLGYPEDTDLLEDTGRLDGANSTLVSETARKRGADQLGTLGSGNHFLEIEAVDEIFDQTAAKAFGLSVDQVVVAIHCGSRGLGHQICTDYVKKMLPHLDRYGIVLPDRELACAPADSDEGKDYLAAMAAAANFAWANRQVIAHHVREEWRRLFGDTAKLTTLYDVCHNIAKRERHAVRNQQMELLVHRKGATRAFGPGRAEVPERYRAVGQPVLIPGTMGTASYILRGTDEAMSQTFGTVCHGAGRRLSRHAAKRTVQGSELKQRLERQGIVVRCFSASGLAEEAPEAYKDVEEVVGVVQAAGLSSKVARLRPIAVIKGD
jgi:tRNA-splicing ligase RtcB